MPAKPVFLATILLGLTLTGCSQLQFPGVHKFDIQQGNIITQEMVDQLKPGMTKSQVRFVMGTPLIADSFNQNRWDYFYNKRKAKGGEEREQLTILFDSEEKLIGLAGDYAPSTADKPTPKTQKAE